MKKKYIFKFIVYGLALLVCFGFFTSSSDTDHTNKVTTVSVDVTFGRGPSCIGRGLCSVAEVNQLAGPGGDAAGLMWIASGGSLQLEISKSSISVQQKEQQFVDGLFKVIDAYTLPLPLSTTIGANAAISIGSGDYPIQEYSDRYTIGF